MSTQPDTTTPVCCYCGTGHDLRPYGPGGAPTCHPCATATPQRETAAVAAFAALLDAAEAISPNGLVILGGEGPYPFSPLEFS